MTIHNCHDCGQPVARRDAYLRSVSLRQVAFHGQCLRVRAAVDAVFENAAPELSALVSLVGARNVA